MFSFNSQFVFSFQIKIMSESTKVDNELTKNAVEIRQIIQDFPLCSTFREIDDQNALGMMHFYSNYFIAPACVYIKFIEEVVIVTEGI